MVPLYSIAGLALLPDYFCRDFCRCNVRTYKLLYVNIITNAIAQIAK